MTLVEHVLLISTKHLTEFAKQYKEAVNRYAKAHFENRSFHFTPNMIAISNNCASLIDNALKFQKDYKKDDKNQIELDKAFSQVVSSFNSLKKQSIGYLIKEIFMDVDKEISKVGSQEWLEGAASIIENVCLTLEDYFRDYIYLKESNADELKVQLQKALAKAYIQAIMSRYAFYEGFLSALFDIYFSVTRRCHYETNRIANDTPTSASRRLASWTMPLTSCRRLREDRTAGARAVTLKSFPS